MLDEVTEEMRVDQDPPDGILFHTHFEQDGQDGRVRVVDVWESQEAYERFRDTRLIPAMGP